MQYELYQRTGTTHDKLLAVYGTERLAREAVKEIELVDVMQNKYEPHTYFIKEVGDETCTVQEL